MFVFGQIADWGATAERLLQYLGPLAGAIITFRLVLKFQRDVVDGAMLRAADLEDRLAAAEAKIDALERETAQCDRRNAILVRTLIHAGIDVPPEAMVD